ncbi:hypothetical protein GGR88_001068 [Sphingomonas jejuensis]|uniref:Uncharacterized protein n=1 Tax=Sphingomonas jejuensis TaxID=904715 RepID=A0ABX0XL87_9SPHN|nr:hypothetical protein [Sphingomonas jejuensis]NJC33594.1 hypothetical protein [Sphingomonas jejuensis]
MAIEFLSTFGFSEDPFASTNAADEPLIENYFVQPPFFPAVIGDPRKPKSNVVFAPRGGGKTAQKIMIERKSLNDSSFLCISYDRFPLEGLKQVSDADSEYHITNITRLLLVALLVEFSESGSGKLEEVDRKLVVDLSRSLLGDLSTARLKEQIEAVKSLGDRAGDIWRKYGGAALSLVNAFVTSNGGAPIEILSNQERVIESMRFKFEALVTLATKLGFSSVYILVDRADELPQTVLNADKAFALLSSILLDLPLLETPGIAFKFFLWDKTKEDYRAAGGRSDRVIEYSLVWSVAELERVLELRLETYSGGRISRFDQLVTSPVPFNIHRMIAYFANGSPRDMVRICKKIVDEHTKSGQFGRTIEFRTVKSAMSLFSLERAQELYGTAYADLKKIGELTFTINSLANDVFRVTTQAARAKVQGWQNSGAVVKVGDVPNPGNRPLYLYGVTDPRLALAILSDASLEEALENYLVICPHCSSLRIGTEGSITCPDCQGSFELTDAATLAEVCQVS